MLPRWLMTVLMLFMEAWSARRDAQIKLLMLQVELLRCHGRYAPRAMHVDSQAIWVQSLTSSGGSPRGS
ncbi:MAG: hypothetical protein WD118_11385 [Phycisphaeraceae bacterium]